MNERGRKEEREPGKCVIGIERVGSDGGNSCAVLECAAYIGTAKFKKREGHGCFLSCLPASLPSPNILCVTGREHLLLSDPHPFLSFFLFLGTSGHLLLFPFLHYQQ